LPGKNKSAYYTLNNYSGTINQALSESWPTIVNLMDKISADRGQGFWNRFNPEKKNFDKKIDKVLEKGAKAPQELIENVKTESGE
jgi:hypothetical protein